MALLENILFPFDFSGRCQAVWPAVAKMARHLSVPITVVHARDIDHHHKLPAPGPVGVVRENLMEALSHVVPTKAEGPNVRYKVVDGPAAECIVQCAATLEAPLIMMPTRGHTRFRQLLLGSVTAAVLHDAVCPVWTDAHTQGETPRSGEYHSMVCAVDMGPRTPEVLRTAYEFSTLLGATLQLVHSIPGIDPRFPSGPANRAHQFLVDKACERFVFLRSKVEIRAPLEIVQDVGIVNGIVSAVSRHGADLLIIGRGVIHGPLGRLRTNAHELIRRSPSPVLSV